jgi:hypothetical protein
LPALARQMNTGAVSINNVLASVSRSRPGEIAGEEGGPSTAERVNDCAVR